MQTLTTRRALAATALDPVDDLGVPAGVVHPEAAGQHHGVDGRRGSGSGWATNAKPGAGAGRLAVGGYEGDVVAVVAAARAGQHSDAPVNTSNGPTRSSACTPG